MRFDVRGLGVSVSSSTGTKALLEGVGLGLSGGEGVHLKGRSGLGKTTLLRTLAALHADPGTNVTLDGQSVLDLGEPTWRTRCMLVAQAPTMIPGSVRENLERPFTFAAARATFDPSRAAELLREVGVFDDPTSEWDREASQLSGGERQRVHLVRALLLEPDVLLADEPVASLDAESAALVWKLLRGFRDRGGCVVLVHHGESPDDYASLDLGSFACRT